jgi:hypothetical protein
LAITRNDPETYTVSAAALRPTNSTHVGVLMPLTVASLQRLVVGQGHWVRANGGLV